MLKALALYTHTNFYLKEKIAHQKNVTSTKTDLLNGVGILKKIYNSKKLQSETGREYYFDNLKFLLIFLVVLGHFAELIMRKSEIAKTTWMIIYSFHMPLFIFVSGFFAKNAVKNRNYNKSIMFFILYFIMKTVIFIVDKSCGLNPNYNFTKINSIQWYIFAMGAWYLISILLRNANKKIIFMLSVFFALIIGFDKNIGDIWGVSRILVFYPFFLLGLNINNDKLFKIVKNKGTKIIAPIYLIILVLIFVLFIDKIYLVRPILTGRNPYSSLNNSIEQFGVLIRMCWYIVATFTGICIMSLVPKGKTIITNLGQRTISVYFYHAIIIRIFSNLEINYRMYEGLILSIFMVLIFSIKCFAIPLEKLLKINLLEKSKLKI